MSGARKPEAPPGDRRSRSAEPRQGGFRPDARTVFVKAVDGHRAEMEELEFPARLKGSWSKLEAYLARLSLILALCRCVDDVAPERVENRDVLGAVVLLDYFKVQTRRVYMGLYGEDPLDLLAADLRRLLEERGGFFTGAPTELHRELKSEHKGGQSNALTRRVKEIQRRSPVLRFEEKKENYTKQDGSRSTRNVVILALRDSPYDHRTQRIHRIQLTRRERKEGRLTEQQTITARTDNNGLPAAIPPAKRDAPRGMLPSTLMGCSLRVEYTDSDGSGRETSGVLLDWCPVGPVLNVRVARTLVYCDRIGILELVE